MLNLRRHPDAESFLASAFDALARSETANNLILGVPLRLRAHPERIKHAPFLVTVHDETGRMAGAAVRTLPYSLVIHVEAGFGEEVLDTVLAEVVEERMALNGVNGRVPWSEALARRWERVSGRRAKLEMALRAFELHTVIPPRPAPGFLRPARQSDLDLVGRFLRAFDAEAIPSEAGERSDESIRLSLEDGNYFLWEIGGAPVCLVARSRPLVRTITIAPVYTPPPERGRGYASNAVARLSQDLLDSGWQACALFTDLANPVSNSVYQKIGYQPVCDYANYVFAQS